MTTTRVLSLRAALYRGPPMARCGEERTLITGGLSDETTAPFPTSILFTLNLRLLRNSKAASSMAGSVPTFCFTLTRKGRL